MNCMKKIPQLRCHFDEKNIGVEVIDYHFQSTCLRKNDNPKTEKL